MLKMRIVLDVQLKKLFLNIFRDFAKPISQRDKEMLKMSDVATPHTTWGKLLT